MSLEELKNYDGSNGYPLYIAIIGEVYDVSKNERIYGKYHHLSYIYTILVFYILKLKLVVND